MLGNVLKGLGSNPTSGQPRVARVTLLGADGVQRTYDGTLVGVDRARDLLVLRVDAPADLLRPVRVGTSAGLKVGQQVRRGWGSERQGLGRSGSRCAAQGGRMEAVAMRRLATSAQIDRPDGEWASATKTP